jgi:acyl-CoA synthetase (AMP-forming)/AMP-acid ligase II
LNETQFATQKGAGICVGKPVNGMQVKIISISDAPILDWDNSLERPPAEVGEIVIAGAAVTSAYIGRANYNLLAKIAHPSTGTLHRTGDLGWLDEAGRLWYCGRKSQRVETPQRTYFTEAVEGIFNAHPLVYRTALVGVRQLDQVVPVLWVELKSQRDSRLLETIKEELLEIGAQHEMTRQIQMILFRKAFPTDVRHNSKIIREKLALLAGEHFR